MAIKKVVIGEPAPQKEAKPSRIASIKAKLSQQPIAEEPDCNDGIALASDDVEIPQQDASPQAMIPDPSVYYQVLENMNKINDLLSQITVLEADIQKKIDTLTDVDNSLKNDIKKLDNSVSNVSKSISILVNAVGSNTPPSAYKNDITFEIKLASAVGLGPAQGLIGTEHVFVQTVSAQNLEGVGLTTFQTATITGETNYARTATEANGWNPWVIVNTGGGGGEVIYSPSQPGPGVQNEGGLWLSPAESLST